MYNINYHKRNNRIHISIEGALASQQADRYMDDLMGVVDLTSPGFTIFVDLSKSDMSVLEDSGKYQKQRDYAALKGMKSVATVLSHKAYTIYQTRPFQGIKNVFDNIKEAQEYLDK